MGLSLLGFTKFYRDSVGLAGFFWFLLGFTEFYLVMNGCTPGMISMRRETGG